MNEFNVLLLEHLPCLCGYRFGRGQILCSSTYDCICTYEHNVQMNEVENLFLL